MLKPFLFLLHSMKMIHQNSTPILWPRTLEPQENPQALHLQFALFVVVENFANKSANNA